ncbi:hypothetical protein HNP65_001850, partial [Thermosipho japonicus]|nr:hypothetical protein [Thermosipho japonicus]
FMEREINRLIYSKRWEIEWYIERLKQRIKMRYAWIAAIYGFVTDV